MRLRFTKRLLIAVRFQQSQARLAFGCPRSRLRKIIKTNTCAKHASTAERSSASGLAAMAAGMAEMGAFQPFAGAEICGVSPSTGLPSGKTDEFGRSRQP